MGQQPSFWELVDLCGRDEAAFGRELAALSAADTAIFHKTVVGHATAVFERMRSAGLGDLVVGDSGLILALAVIAGGPDVLASVVDLPERARLVEPHGAEEDLLSVPEEVHEDLTGIVED